MPPLWVRQTHYNHELRVAPDACSVAGQDWTAQELGKNKEAAHEGPTSH